MSTFATFRGGSVVRWVLAGEPRELPAPAVEDAGLRFHLPNARTVGRRRDGSPAKLPVCLTTEHPVSGAPPAEGPYVSVEGDTYRIRVSDGWTRPDFTPRAALVATHPPSPIPTADDLRNSAAWWWIQQFGAGSVVGWSQLRGDLLLTYGAQSSPVPDDLPVTVVAYGSLAMAQWVGEGSPTTVVLSALEVDAVGIPTASRFIAGAVVAPPLRRWRTAGLLPTLLPGDVIFVALTPSPDLGRVFQVVTPNL